MSKKGKRFQKQLHRVKNRETHGFTQIDNRALRDKRLSYAATGLLSYVLSHSDDFDITTRLLINAKTDGKDKVNSILKELMNCGYAEKENEKK